MAGPVACAIIDVEALGDAAPDDGVPEHRQECLDVLGGVEGGEGDDAGSVVDEGDEVGLSRTF